MRAIHRRKDTSSSNAASKVVTQTALALGLFAVLGTLGGCGMGRTVSDTSNTFDDLSGLAQKWHEPDRKAEDGSPASETEPASR